MLPSNSAQASTVHRPPGPGSGRTSGWPCELWNWTVPSRNVQPSSRRHHATYSACPAPTALPGRLNDLLPRLLHPGGHRPGVNAVPNGIQCGCPGELCLTRASLGVRRFLSVPPCPRPGLFRRHSTDPATTRNASRDGSGAAGANGASDGVVKGRARVVPVAGRRRPPIATRRCSTSSRRSARRR